MTAVINPTKRIPTGTVTAGITENIKQGIQAYINLKAHM